MFHKFIKKSFVALLLFSYATTALSMEQQQPQSKWQKVKGWICPNRQTFEKAKNAYITTIPYILNSRFILKGIAGLYHSYLEDRSQLVSLASLDSSSLFSKEKAIAIKNVLLNMRLSPEIKVESGISAIGSPAISGHNYLSIDTTFDSLFDMNEQMGTIAHEGGHIKNNHTIKKSLFSLALPILSFGIIKGYAWGSHKLLQLLYSKYPSIRKPLEICNRINNEIIYFPLTNYLLSSYLFTLFYRHCEYEADYESALAVGVAPSISYFKKNEDPVFAKKFAEIAGLRALEARSIEARSINSMSWLAKLYIIAFQIITLGPILKPIDDGFGMFSHPSFKDRIKALEMLAKK